MIFEGVITTVSSDGEVHITPMGFRRDDGHIRVAPFVPSITLENLQRQPSAVMNLSDDVAIFAGCLTGRRDWPLLPAEKISGWRLRDCLAHLEFEVAEVLSDAERPVFVCRIVHQAAHQTFRGFNRAQAAVVEASILVSRLDWLDSAKLVAEMRYLHIAIAKTAGPEEAEAWRWLVAAVNDHPRHRNLLDFES